MKNLLNILLNGKLVGQLEKTSAGGMQFKYDATWLKTKGARPISLSMPLMLKQYKGDLVYNFFDNLLPDNLQIRSRIQAKFNIPNSHSFDLLATIGKDCVGALQLVDPDVVENKNEILFHPLKEKEIANLLRNTQSFPLGMGADTDDFRISIAGAQEKTAFLLWDNKWNRPLKTTPTTHIFKLPIGYIQHQNLDLSQSCENEWICAQIAEAFGLPVAKCEIQVFEDVKVLIVERFDRLLVKDKSWIMRLPQEDMCQALGFPSHLKYQSDGGPGIENIMKFLLGSAQTISDRENFFKAQILFYLLAAIDGHAKNFSIFIEPDGSYGLTPLYDIMSAYPLLANNQLHIRKIKMAMALKGKNQHYHWNTIQRRHFISTAKLVTFSTVRAEEIMDSMLEKIDDVIEVVSNKLPKHFPFEIANPIFSGMKNAKQRLLNLVH